MSATSVTQWWHRRGSLQLGERPHIMAVVNVTPDSFSDGGRFRDPLDAVPAALAAAAAGADIVDIGGESTRPGADRVTAEEEIRRTVPVIEALRRSSDVVISIDTSKVRVAEAAIRAGADIVNDVSGFTFEPELAALVAATNAGCVLMHTPGRSDTMMARANYEDVVESVRDHLTRSVALATAAGTPATHICLDPGFGFGKLHADNYRLLARLAELVDPYPVLAGLSRKRMIGEAVGDDPYAIEHGSTAANVLAMVAGARVLRVHDVRAAVAATQVFRSWSEGRLSR